MILDGRKDGGFNGIKLVSLDPVLEVAGLQLSVNSFVPMWLQALEDCMLLLMSSDVFFEVPILSLTPVGEVM